MGERGQLGWMWEVGPLPTLGEKMFQTNVRGLPFEIQRGVWVFTPDINYFFQIARAQLLFFQFAKALLFFLNALIA